MTTILFWTAATIIFAAGVVVLWFDDSDPECRP